MSATSVDVTRRRRVLQIVRYEGPAVAGWIAHCTIRQNQSAAKVPTDLRWLADHGLIANANLDPDARADWVLTIEGESYLDRGICTADYETLRNAQCTDEEIAAHLFMHTRGQCPTYGDADVYQEYGRLIGVFGGMQP